MAEAGHGRAWPLADANLTNTVRNSRFATRSLIDLFFTIDPGVSSTSWAVQAVEEGC